MKEIILKKVSVFKTKIEIHLLKTIDFWLENNKNYFQARSWDCNTKTSKELYKNILYEIEEFKYIKKGIEDMISSLLKTNYNKEIPFMIISSWINILKDKGYQEFHTHKPSFGSGVLYLSTKNSCIEFSIFPEDIRKKIFPEKGDLLLFDSSTFHRVLDTDEERISLAFNFHATT